ncbi:Holliday junction DNA helicase RuvA (plasmid) [Euzebya pacifica]|uniref:Holliday junction branch migration complex subunit RuvA n=1 Tax=Euzebya pacifica TaxID=1608957 RepID=A0A346Y705_9ACTN|nr:Holliday junction branch migration protein RuvA [Euzebya pacifica]AXV10252.1 Holliday junction DNA helicase RuvA [Euzebya pacifica]
MIFRLRGTVEPAGPDRTIVDVGGVGYLVHSGYDWAEGDAVVHVHTVVREDAMDLYGFPTAADRDLFVAMLGLQGVGPKTAMAALTTVGAAGLAAAVAADDVSALTAVPGIGVKSARKIMFELRANPPEGLDDTTQASGKQSAATVRADAISALQSLGYKPVEARRMVDGANGETVEAIVASALSAGL